MNYYLALSAGLCLVLWIPYTVERIFTRGLIDTVGYPDDPPASAKWAQRCKSAHYNMVENLIVFAVLGLLTNDMAISNENTVFASMIFFYARFIHAIVFILGIPWVRTLAFVTSWVSMIVIFMNICCN